MKKEVKISTKEKNFYLSLIGTLKETTNLTKIQEKFNITKQQLNYYLRELVKRGIITHEKKGWYEVVKGVKISTKYGSLLVKDSSRGHAYIWDAKIEKIPDNWEKRIEVLENRKVHYKLVGAKLTTPRIMVQGRKVWLCNNKLRIFDKKDASYYGENAKKSRLLAFQEIKLIIDTLNHKLGTEIKPSAINFQREHYALIKNDLAIEENKKGNIIHISDEDGEWLLIDDSLGLGGELENIGKK
jgi:predicted transcriptional regulator